MGSNPTSAPSAPPIGSNPTGIPSLPPIGTNPTGVPSAPLVATNPVEDIIVLELRKEDAKASYLGAVTREGAIQSDKDFARDQQQKKEDIHTDSSI